MKSFIEYIMHGRLQATGVTGLFGVLSWMFPPLSYVSGAAVGLVTLRNGAQSGLAIIGGAAFLCGLVAWGGAGTPWPAFPLVLALWLPVWTGAQVLRFTRSQGVMLAAIGAMAALFAIGMRALIGDVQAWWHELLRKFFERAMSDNEFAFGPAVLEQAAGMMNAFMSGALVMSVAVPLLIARWWQAILYNPGGFGTEFRELQLPRLLALPVALAALYVSIQVMQNGIQGLIVDLLFVAMVLYMFQGIAIAHYYIHQRNGSMRWTVALYAALIFVQPYSILALATAGLADSGMDFRRLGRSNG